MECFWNMCKFEMCSKDEISLVALSQFSVVMIAKNNIPQIFEQNNFVHDYRCKQISESSLPNNGAQL